jgi:hypothetical protein
VNSQNRKALDLVGLKIGHCVVESQAPSVSNQSRWRIRCSCGALFLAETGTVKHAAKRGAWGCSTCWSRRRVRREPRDLSSG